MRYPHSLMNSTTPVDLQHGIARAISREDMANLPIRRYEGEVCLVTTPQERARALADLRQESVVGFDTETRPSFSKGESHPTCLVQAATASRVYLFQLRRPDVFQILTELLAQPRIVKAGVALAYDLRSLKLVFSFTEKNVLDLGVVARRWASTRPACATSPGFSWDSGFPKAPARQTGPRCSCLPSRLPTPRRMPGCAANCSCVSRG